MRGTQKALMARGLDSNSAATLANDGWTLDKLKLSTRPQLTLLGLSDDFVDALFKEPRPPIPNSSLMSVLFANRYQCCVCRDPNLSVIVHHIDEWAASRLHDVENLAVLCLHHHDEAHSRKSLSKNLDAKVLRSAKQKWEAEVKKFDSRSIRSAMSLEYSNWNYMNELRIFELARNIGVKFSSLAGFSGAVSAGVAQMDGLPVPVMNESSFYMYEGPGILFRYFYVAEVFSKVIDSIAIVNISDFLDKGVLGCALVPGDFIFVQGAHVFSPLTDKARGKGRGQICQGLRRANKVEVRFTFDRWEASSSSARHCWLVGTNSQGSLVQVKTVTREEGVLIISGTVLGICSVSASLKTREYAQSWLDWMPDHQGDFDESDEFLDL